MTELWKYDERLARRIVATVLGVPVERCGDGTAPFQTTATIRYPDGTAWMEIITDADSAFRIQWSALEKMRHRLEVPGLRQSWRARLTPTASVRIVRAHLPLLVLSWQDKDQTPDTFAEYQSELSSIGVDGVTPIPGHSPQGGVVHLRTSGWSGSAEANDRLGEWVVGVLAEQGHVPRQLAACPARERHVFIWVAAGNHHRPHFGAGDRDGTFFPVAAPNLPDGVTHVWVAGSDTRPFIWAWFPDQGWWQPHGTL